MSSAAPRFREHGRVSKFASNWRDIVYLVLTSAPSIRVTVMLYVEPLRGTCH